MFLEKIFFIVFLNFSIIYCLEKTTNETIDDKEFIFETENHWKSLNDCIEEKLKCIIVCNQDVNGIYIYDLKHKKLLWKFIFKYSEHILDEHKRLFKAISDAKLVYDGKYILSSSSGGGSALIEIKTKKIVKYFIDEGNIHSIELTPDGSFITIASSQNYFTIHSGPIEVFPNYYYKRKFDFPFGHALVWDNKRQLLWVGGNRTLHSYKYNYDSLKPNLKLYQNFFIDDDQIHDLFPIHGCSDLMWITTLDYVYIFNIKSGYIHKIYDINDVKSISSLKNKNKKLNKSLCSIFENNLNFSQNLYTQKILYKYNTTNFENDLNSNFNTIYVTPQEEWWTDRISFLSTNKTALKIKKAKIYKARWFVLNSFSYDLFYSHKFE